MNDYKPYKQLKQKQKAKVVERIYKELHQFFSDNQRFPDTPDEHELLAHQIFSHIPYRVSFDELDDLKKPKLHQKAGESLQQILSKNPHVDFAALCNYVRQSQI